MGHNVPRFDNPGLMFDQLFAGAMPMANNDAALKRWKLQTSFLDTVRDESTFQPTDLRRFTAELARRIFDAALWRADQPLRVVLIGTDFEVRVWEMLLKIPMGRAMTYSDIATKVGAATAARAVGAAVGKNPLSFVVPCHRVLGRDGALTGYHWGLTRKRAMLGWEAGRTAS